jgi:hypothetical protein
MVAYRGVSMSPPLDGRDARSRYAHRAKLSREEDAYPFLAGEDDARSFWKDLNQPTGAAGRGNRLADEGVEASMPAAETPPRIERLRRPAIAGDYLALDL